MALPDHDRDARHRLWGLGAILLAAFAFLAGLDPQVVPVRFLLIVGVTALGYGAALVIVSRTPPSSRRGLAVCLALAALWRVPLLVAPPELSDDVYRYVWDGRLQRLGHDPYVSAPGDPDLQTLHTPVTRLTNNPRLPTIYPPGAQGFFRAVASIQESILAMKLALVLCEGLVVWLLLKWLAIAGQGPWWVLAYAWNPLVTLEIAAGGHLDALGMTLVLASAVSLALGRRFPAALALAGAIAVKFLPVVLAPLFWGRVRAREVVLAGVVFLGLYLPFVGVGLSLPTGSLAEYLEKWRFNGPLFVALEASVGGLVDTPVLLAFPVVAGLAVGVWARARRPVASPAAWAWPMAAALLLMPAVYPWYLLWLMPFVTSVGTLPLMVWTVGSLLTYVVWYFVPLGGSWQLPGWLLAIEYGSVALVAIWCLWRAPRSVGVVRVAEGAA